MGGDHLGNLSRRVLGLGGFFFFLLVEIRELEGEMLVSRKRVQRERERER